MTRNDVIAGYMLNEKHVIAEMLYDTITKYEELLKPKKCSECLHYGLGNCLLKRDCEMVGGIGGYCYIEIDNPDDHYCADYEDRIK